MTIPAPVDTLPLPAGIRQRSLPGLNGLTVNVLEAGHGTPGRPAVLLHGFPDLAYSWRKTMLPLAAAGYHVIAPDARGYGATTGWPDTYWDGLAMILSFINKQEGGAESGSFDRLKGKRIGYLYLDAGFGKEPIPLLEQLGKDIGFQVKAYPVAGAEMQNQSSQWLGIRRDKPDYIILFGWGVMNPTAIKEAIKAGCFAGQDTVGRPTTEIVRRGCIQVMEGRHCFGHLTVEENLLTGAFTRTDGRDAVHADLELIYGYFPRLHTRRTSLAGYTSGGEQQMCAIGRALMSRPRLILLDEPSMGLAPQLTEEIFEIVRRLNVEQGVSFLVAEQNTALALRYASHGYVLENGRLVMEGTAERLLSNDDVRQFYLGMGESGRRSFRDTKSYKRRKRWLA